MPDLIDELFAGETYPGSKQKRDAPPAPTPSRIKEDWESNGKEKTLPNGSKALFYTIGDLGAALGKRPVTLRMWEDKGYLPKTPYRLPSQVVGDKIRRGPRLWTWNMIHATEVAFSKRGLIDVPRIDWAAHADLGQELETTWQLLLEQDRKGAQ